MFVCGSSVHQKCYNYALTNLLFGLCKSMWIIDSLVTRFSPHPRAITHSSTPKMLQAKEHTPIPYPSVFFTFGFAIEYIKEFGNASFPITWITILHFTPHPQIVMSIYIYNYWNFMNEVWMNFCEQNKILNKYVVNIIFISYWNCMKFYPLKCSNFIH